MISFSSIIFSTWRTVVTKPLGQQYNSAEHSGRREKWKSFGRHPTHLAHTFAQEGFPLCRKKCKYSAFRNACHDLEQDFNRLRESAAYCSDTYQWLLFYCFFKSVLNDYQWGNHHAWIFIDSLTIDIKVFTIVFGSFDHCFFLGQGPLVERWFLAWWCLKLTRALKEICSI